MEQIKVKLTEDIYVTVNVETPSPSRAMEYCVNGLSNGCHPKILISSPKLILSLIT